MVGFVQHSVTATATMIIESMIRSELEDYRIRSKSELWVEDAYL